MPPFKLDQVAFYAADLPRLTQRLSNQFGLTEWVHDFAIGDGFVFGVPVMDIVGELWFNYQTGLEVELLRYHSPMNWHAVRDPRTPVMRPFFSHIGTHVEDMAVARLPYEAAGWKVAQELWTKSHTNQYLKDRGRTYHYVVWDSRDIIGFDVKLIQRIERKGD